MKKDCNNRVVSAIVLTMLLCVMVVSGCGKSSSKALSEYREVDAEESLRNHVAIVTNEKDAGPASDEAAKNNIIQFPGTAADTVSDANARTTLSREGYSLEKAVVLSRHNIRAPLSGAGSALDTIPVKSGLRKNSREGRA